MSTVVQQTYAPQIDKGVEGQIADATSGEWKTGLCLTSAGLGFGKAVSQGSSSQVDKAVIIGGSKFLGITCKDMTLALANVDPLNSTPYTLDKYGLYTNVCYMTRGRMWVRAETNVAAGDSLYYDYVTGSLGNSAAGRAPRGAIVFSKNPDDDETLVLGGVTVTFGATVDGTHDEDVGIGPTLGDTLVNLAAYLNSAPGGAINNCKYAVYPSSPGGSGQGSGANTLMIASTTDTGADNTWAIDASGAVGATASGATLDDGYAGVASTGSMVFSVIPTTGSTVTFGTTVVTFCPNGDPPDPGEMALGTTLALTMDDLATYLLSNASSDYTYTSAGTPTHDRINVAKKVVGTVGNAFALATDDPAGTVSGATLSGGTPPSVVATGGKWWTSAIAGQLAMVGLSYQK